MLLVAVAVDLGVRILEKEMVDQVVDGMNYLITQLMQQLVVEVVLQVKDLKVVDLLS